MLSIKDANLSFNLTVNLNPSQCQMKLWALQIKFFNHFRDVLSDGARIYFLIVKNMSNGQIGKNILKVA